MNIKVAVYEDNQALRETLAEIIRSSEGFELAGEFGHCLDVVNNCKAYQPDVIIMDIDMPGKSGIEGLKELKAAFPNIEVIINTVFDDDQKIFEAIKSGATGYLLKKNSLSTLMSSIREVHAGGAPMNPSIARKVLLLQQDKDVSPEIKNLSEKELIILNHLARGLSYKMISAECNISIDSVRTYIKRIYSKLHVHSVTEAVHKIYLKN